MNRTTAAVLATTAAIGITGGAVTAVVRGQDPAAKPPASGTGKPSNTASPKPTDEPEQTPRQRLLWADDTLVHDGAREIGFPGTPTRAPDRLVRVDGGYLLAFDNEPGTHDDQALYFVSSSGATQVLAQRARGWDVSPAGDKVVVHNLRNLQVVGFDGVVQESTGAPEGEQGVLWEGGTVTVHALEPETGWRIWTWEPGDGKPELTDRVGFADPRADRPGDQVVGPVGYEGFSTAEQNFCVGTGPNAGADTGVTWFTCDWRLNGPRLNPISPGGERLLVIHAQSDGFGPGAFGIVDLAKGPAAGVPTVNAPEDWMLDAVWVDDDHFAMVGSNGDEVGAKGGWLYLSDTTGQVDEVARTKTGRITLGEQY